MAPWEAMALTRPRHAFTPKFPEGADLSRTVGRAQFVLRLDTIWPVAVPPRFEFV